MKTATAAPAQAVQFKLSPRAMTAYLAYDRKASSRGARKPKELAAEVSKMADKRKAGWEAVAAAFDTAKVAAPRKAPATKVAKGKSGLPGKGKRKG